MLYSYSLCSGVDDNELSLIIKIPTKISLQSMADIYRGMGVVGRFLPFFPPLFGHPIQVLCRMLIEGVSGVKVLLAIRRISEGHLLRLLNINQSYLLDKD